MVLFQFESKDLTGRRTYGLVPFGRLAGSRPRMSQRFSSHPKTGKIQCPSLKAVKPENFDLLGRRSAFLFYSNFYLVR